MAYSSISHSGSELQGEENVIGLKSTAQKPAGQQPGKTIVLLYVLVALVVVGGVVIAVGIVQSGKGGGDESRGRTETTWGEGSADDDDDAHQGTSGDVVLKKGPNSVVLSNGIVAVEFSKSGLIIGISYSNIGNLFEQARSPAWMGDSAESDGGEEDDSESAHFVVMDWLPGDIAPPEEPDTAPYDASVNYTTTTTSSSSRGNSSWSIDDFPESLGSDHFLINDECLYDDDANSSSGSAQMPPLDVSASMPGRRARTGGDPQKRRPPRRSHLGYYDMVWADCNVVRPKHGCAKYERFGADEYRRITSESNTDHVEISFVQLPGKGGQGAPVTIDMRYVMRRGESGFYSYLIIDHEKGKPEIHIGELRLVLRLRPDIFTYAALADNRRRTMPQPGDLSAARSSPLEFKEARLLTNPVNPDFKNEYDHKYHYSADIKDMIVHGWVAPSADPAVGIWMISPSRMEYMGGGPEKQDLTVQVGPIILNMLHSGHYGTPAVFVAADQVWRKTYGPYFIYLNGASESVCSGVKADRITDCLWEDASSRAAVEEKAWPYDWATSSDYPSKGSRGSVSGLVKVEDPDWNASQSPFRAGKPGNSWVGLAAEGPAGTWAVNSNGYQYWSQIEGDGHFLIPNVRPGSYSLFSYVGGVVGDHVLQQKVVVGSEGDKNLDVGTKVVRPPRKGPTIWSIGVPDRSFGEFFVPVLNPRSPWPYPSTGPDRWRNYGAWLTYKESYPESDPVFDIGSSDFSRDWYFVQCLRPRPQERGKRSTQRGSPYLPTVRRINFDLEDPWPGATYTLRMAIAGAHHGAIGVAINRPSNTPYDFRTPAGGRDNAMARASDHGQYLQYEVGIPGSKLLHGRNTIYLTLDSVDGRYNYVGYDFIRLEGPG
ncbi:hypothetical protein CBR_g50015 [Chara braunii]|uniref:rhamnogalacturonan endolyase n=1 Tax=Chara braunii TaxID=69332 RepID=A0A388K593_CHABU|nr:hypothetical protein CBR_g50015 [Chara braunii]|eukprot:GBG65224.1 hypothetical protein CBR_g50015 [Chara braunii]